MLTSDLLRARVRRDEVKPLYLDPKDPATQELAASLIDLFRAHRGKSRGELVRELDDLLGTGTDFLLHRGLAKLLFDRCEFSTRAEVDPVVLRQAVFTAAAAAHRGESPTRGAGPTPFSRPDLVSELCRQLDLPETAFDTCLYADLKDEQVVDEFPALTPAALLHRYNCALAQATLLRAQDLEIRISRETPTRYRALFRKIKFFQLLHRVEGNQRDGYVIRLDGPLSLFKAGNRYGFKMASFLPTLLHFQGWTLTASLLWGKKRRPCRFRLSPADELKPYTRLTGQWQPEEVAWLGEQFPGLDSDWHIAEASELVDLGGQGVLVPDYVFEHRGDAQGHQRVFLEVFGFWNRGAVQARLKLLAERGPSNLILALSRSLSVDESELEDLPATVYVFRTHPRAREVLKILERMRSDTGVE